MAGFDKFEERVKGYLPPEKIAQVKEAFDFAVEAHRGQVRLSGEPFFEHPFEVALILTELQLDAGSIMAALLHDIPENCDIPLSKIESIFGGEIAKLVDGVTKLGKLSWEATEPSGVSLERQAANLRKMLVAMAEDLRVVFIKLADRLHNMRTLEALPEEKRRRIASETLEIYAPLAHRLGIWELKWQLEDLSFRYLEPEEYHRIAKLVSARRAEREKFLAEVTRTLASELAKAGINAEVVGRPKHIYSIKQKMDKYASLGKDFDDIHDLLALRVLVSDVHDCYAALGVIHTLWHPIPEEFDDYIANPKPNGYRSLHTSVMCRGATPLEVQIRTYEMHHVDEYGVAAHWRYKEGEASDLHFEERISWLRQLIEWHREFTGAEEFLESVKTDIFIDQVFVFTPRGEIKELPKGSTPLDFAYRIHTELGHRCIGAKVNGRLVPLTYELKNGDAVEILQSKTAKGPSRDWLNPNLGYIKTSHAREKIRQWFRRQERADNIERGRELLEREQRRLGLRLVERVELAKLFKYENVDDFLAALGCGEISVHQIALKLATQVETPKPVVEYKPPKRPASSVEVLGAGEMLTQLAKCCHPVPGDEIIGYITRNRGVTIHRRDCYNVIHEDEKERLIPVSWGASDSTYPVSIKVEAWDRVGLVRDITTLVAEEKVNIAAISSLDGSERTPEGYFNLYITLETKSLTQLSRLLAKIEAIRGVISVSRIDSGVALKSNPSEK